MSDEVESYKKKFLDAVKLCNELQVENDELKSTALILQTYIEVLDQKVSETLKKMQK